jgi:hypothetical protein
LRIKNMYTVQEILAQLAENVEIVRPDIHNRGSISSHSTLCV